MKRTIQTLVGLILGLFLIWLLFRKTDWPEVWAAIRDVHWGWMLVVQIPLWLSFPIRVQRWTYIVRAAQPASFRHLFAATQIGFLANFTFPARLGEIIRALVLTRLTKMPFSKSFAMVALDRVTDLFGLIAVMLVAVIAYQPESAIVIPAEVFGGETAIEFPASQYNAGAVAAGVFLIIVLAAFVILYVNRKLVLAVSDAVVGVVSKALAKKIHGMIDHFADGLDVFRSPSDMAKSIFFSLLTWLCAVLIAVFMFKAFDVDVPWYSAFVMQAMLAVFIAAPGAPGLVGQFHAPIVITLVMMAPAIDVNEAKAFAIVMHLLNFPPLIALAVYSMVTENLGLMELAKSSMRMASGKVDDSDENSAT